MIRQKMLCTMLEFLVFFLLGISLLAWIGYLCITMWTYHQLPRLLKTSAVCLSEPGPLVSVVVPTRNEAYRVEPCIRSLKAQTYPRLQILIVDDSTDNTVEVIASIIGDDPRFTIVKEEKLPNGWIGKPHALQQGSTLAKGEWLLFIDADTFHDPDLISRAMEYVSTHAIDLLSLVPHHICTSFWEKVIQPVPLGLIIVVSPLAKVNKPESKVVVAFGPFMLMKRSVFDAVGGYETIKNRIADDAEMAKIIKTSGYTVGLANAQTLMHIRMYERFHDIWEGWSKNIFLGMVQKRGIRSQASQLLVIVAGLVGLFGIFVFPLLITLLSLVLYLFTHAVFWQHLLLLSAFTWFFSIIAQGLVGVRYRIGDPKYALFGFLGGLVTMGIFLNSAIKSLSGTGVAWKGRIYADKKS